MNRDNFKILVVDDEKSFLLLLTRILKNEGYDVYSAGHPKDALELARTICPNLVITDLKMPDMDGITLMQEIKGYNDTDFIVITAFATVDTAVEAMKKGALDYITKPLKNPDELRQAVNKVYERQRLETENSFLKASQMSDMPPYEVLFAGMEKTMTEVNDVATTNSTVMLFGETGTGKSLIAKFIHNISGRKGPFVDLNCAAIPESLLESELFGYERGAFTGATSQKKGKFEIADEGTIFLDEVSEMSLALQAKFLKILQDKTFQRLGSLTTLRTNARIIAATNRDLKAMVAERRFREDLYYRLNVFPIYIPPLRERKGHMLQITDFLLRHIALRLGKEVRPMDESSFKRILNYSWPGNVRELENVIERAIIVSKGNTVTIPPLEGDTGVVDRNLSDDVGSMDEIEREAIKKALASVGGNRRQAAMKLGISLRSLQYKIKAYGLN